MEKAQILIVEDDGIIAMDLESRMKKLGYGVAAIVGYGEQAIEKVKENTPDVVLMDIILKGEIDGIEAAEEIRTQYDIPVIFITGYADKDRIKRAKLTYPFGFIVKPFQDKDLEITIEMALYVAKVDAERKKAEERLLEESIMRGVLLDNLPCVALILKKETKEIVASNKAARQIGAVPGKTCYETCALRDDDCPFCLAPQLWATGDPQHLEVKYRGVYYEGIWVPLTDELYVHYIFDITDRKQAEEALRESEEKYRQVFATVSDAIMVFDAETKEFIDANDAVSTIYGYSKEDFLELKHMDITVEPEKSNESIKQTISGEISSIPIRYHKRKDGTTFPVEISSGAFKFRNRQLVYGVARDITDRKQAEEIIKASLKEKEVLLREIHHRAKNNMQTIISLLNLQANKIEDKKYADMFKEGEDRIRSMALIHEQLYQTEDFANIDFGEYIKILTNGLLTSSGVNTNKIRLNIEVKDVFFDIENAIPCGLIINELVSNSLKHAFPQGKEGEISINLRSTNEDEFELSVSDNGIGISGDLDIEQTGTMGLQLVKVLAENQLGGKIDLDRAGGTQFKIKFKRTD